MRCVVLGARGQLGHDLCPLLPGEVLAPPREQADLTRPDELAEWLTQARPSVVINCAAYNFVDRAESEPDAAFAVNTWGVRALANICRTLDCLLVQFSTDHVFGLDDARRQPSGLFNFLVRGVLHVFGLDDARRQPWAEDDAPGPVNVYGLSKLNGEYLVRTLCPHHLVVRTCGLYGLWGTGGKGGNFVETMLRLAGQGKPISVVDDQVCTPSYTIDVAEATVKLIDAGARGLFHLTNSGGCSWYTFARAIFDLVGIAVDLQPTSSALYRSPARRPAYSVLGSGKLCSLGLTPLRTWRDALTAYLSERQRGRCA